MLRARQEDGSEGEEALEKLCRTYWYPLYSYVRRRGYSAHDAEDLTQEFFARFLEKKYLNCVARERGKFRSFLLAAMNHFLANEWDKAKTVKRGGRITLVSIDEPAAEERYSIEPASDFSAEKLFHQRFAETLLCQALAQLRLELMDAGKRDLFDMLKWFLTGEGAAKSYAMLSSEIGMSEGSLKMTVQRMRRRYRELLRHEVAQTVSSPEEIEEELKALIAALS